MRRRSAVTFRVGPALVATAALAVLVLFAMPVRAGKIDSFSGLTPGHTIGGTVTPRGGGADVPLADDVVAADGTVSFLKPDFEIEKIVYVDKTAGVTLQGLTTSDGSDVNMHLTPGDRFPVSSFFDVFIEVKVDLYAPKFMPIDIGDVFFFVAGEHPDHPGLFVFDGPGGTLFTGSLTITGLNVVVSEPGAALVLAVAVAALAAGRRRTAERKRKETGVVT